MDTIINDGKILPVILSQLHFAVIIHLLFIFVLLKTLDNGAEKVIKCFT